MTSGQCRPHGKEVEWRDSVQAEMKYSLSQRRVSGSALPTRKEEASTARTQDRAVGVSEMLHGHQAVESRC